MNTYMRISMLVIFVLCMIMNVYPQVDDKKAIELRQELGIDYSMADFNTSKIDGSVIGTRLARMLELLRQQGHHFEWSNMLIAICREQHERLTYATLEKINIKRIIKQGDVITIVIKLKLGNNAAGLKTTEVPIVFDKGVSASQFVNNLFSNLARYVGED